MFKPAKRVDSGLLPVDMTETLEVPGHITDAVVLQNGSTKAFCSCGWLVRWPAPNDGSAAQGAEMHKYYRIEKQRLLAERQQTQ